MIIMIIGGWYRARYLIPAGGATAATAAALGTVAVVATQEARVVQFRGSSASSFVQHITMAGLTFAHSQPTFLADYELPSGGDWTIHRGGALTDADRC